MNWTAPAAPSLAPIEGIWKARIIGIVIAGTHHAPNQFKAGAITPSSRFMFVMEVPEQTFTNEEGVEEVRVVRYETLYSMGDRANLRKSVDKILAGKEKLTDQEAGSFDFRRLLGAVCPINCQASKDKKYTNVASFEHPISVETRKRMELPPASHPLAVCNVYALKAYAEAKTDEERSAIIASSNHKRMSDLGITVNSWDDLVAMFKNLPWFVQSYVQKSDEGKWLVDNRWLEDVNAEAAAPSTATSQASNAAPKQSAPPAPKAAPPAPKAAPAPQKPAAPKAPPPPPPPVEENGGIAEEDIPFDQKGQPEKAPAPQSRAPAPPPVQATTEEFL